MNNIKEGDDLSVILGKAIGGSGLVSAHLFGALATILKDAGITDNATIAASLD